MTHMDGLIGTLDSTMGEDTRMTLDRLIDLDLSSKDTGEC
jgi:hypothetical protein